MSEKFDNVVGEQQVEQRHDFDLDQQYGDGNIKHTTVWSVPLADALAKDNPSPWATHMWKLYAIMLLVTLST